MYLCFVQKGVATPWGKTLLLILPWLREALISEFSPNAWPRSLIAQLHWTNGVSWTTVALPVQDAKLRWSCFALWEGLDASLPALASAPFDSRTFASGVAVWAAIWKTADWQIKDTLLWGCEM